MLLVITKMRSVLIALVLVSVSECAKLPDSWGTCHKSDKDFSDCLRKNIEMAVRTLDKPVPELGLPALSPMDIPVMSIGAGQGPVNVDQNFKNMKLYGLHNVDVLKADVDFQKKQILATSVNPEIRMEAHYDMKGRVLLLPVVGNGPCNVTLIDLKINHVLEWESVERKGKTYMKAISHKVSLNPGQVIYKFDNLFDGQKELGDNINKVLNENWADVFNDVKDGYEKSFGIIFMGLANRVLPKVPESEIFLD